MPHHDHDAVLCPSILIGWLRLVIILHYVISWMDFLNALLWPCHVMSVMAFHTPMKYALFVFSLSNCACTCYAPTHVHPVQHHPKHPKTMEQTHLDCLIQTDCNNPHYKYFMVIEESFIMYVWLK
jgi:hypothetical protein